jgi:hypothetical protein
LWNWQHLKCCWSGPNDELLQLFVLGSSESSTLLGPLKEYWQGQRFCSGEEVKMAVQEYLPLQEPLISVMMEILSSCQGWINASLG